MELTPLFNTSLSSHKSTLSFKPLKAHPFDIDTLNSFLQESYRIHGHIIELTRYLRSIRAPYLALGSHRPNPSSRQKHHGNGAARESQSMTDDQRELIDSETRSALITLSTSIQDLRTVVQNAAAIQTRVAAKSRSKRGLGALGRWAAGVDVPARTPEELEEEAKIETERLHREGVIYYLQKELEAVSEAQRTMVAVRLQRTVEKNKSVLYKANLMGADGSLLSGPAIEKHRLDSEDLNGGMTGGQNMVLMEEEEQRKKLDDLLSPEQVQMFESEQEDMVRFFNSELQKIRHVESSLVEISQLQTQLSMNLEQQTESLDQLVQDSISTTENIGSGNKELKRATERSSTAKMVFYATCVFCTTLIVWDLII